MLAQILAFLAGKKTHFLVAGAVLKTLLDFASGDLALGDAVTQVLQFLMVSTFKAGVDRKLSSGG